LILNSYNQRMNGSERLSFTLPFIYLSPHKMNNPDNIPDKDLELARKIGDWLDKKLPISELEEPVLKKLLDYKSQKRTEKSANSDSNKEVVWANIRSSIDEEHEDPLPFASTSTAKKWLAAAVLLLAMPSALFFLRPSADDIEIIAQSRSAIETVMLADNSEVILRPNSILYLLSDQSKSKLYKLEGEGYFTITESPDRTISVQAGNGVVDVIGTRFNLREWGDQTEVYLEKGKIQFSLIDRSEKVIVIPGQRSIITPDRQITEPEVTSSEEVSAWRNQELIFHNRKAKKIFEELEFHFGIQITAPELILEEQLGGAISLAELERCLHDLETVLNGKFIATGSEQYQFVLHD